jgi:hypothetical protein
MFLLGPVKTNAEAGDHYIHNIANSMNAGETGSDARMSIMFRKSVFPLRSDPCNLWMNFRVPWRLVNPPQEEGPDNQL